MGHNTRRDEEPFRDYLGDGADREMKGGIPAETAKHQSFSHEASTAGASSCSLVTSAFLYAT